MIIFLLLQLEKGDTATRILNTITETREIELNETILSNQELIIDSENKSITLNGAMLTR